jgi:hypothetical protein
LVTIGGDNEEYTPQSETRRSRSSSKLTDQKLQARYVAEYETKDSDISIYSSGSITKGKIKRINEEEFDIMAKRNKVTSIVHPTHSISVTKAATVPQTVVTSPANPPPPFDRSFIRICLLALLKIWIKELKI